MGKINLLKLIGQKVTQVTDFLLDFFFLFDLFPLVVPQIKGDLR